MGLLSNSIAKVVKMMVMKITPLLQNCLEDRHSCSVNTNVYVLYRETTWNIFWKADRAINKAVSRWSYTAEARVRSHVGFVVDKLALGQAFSELFVFFSVGIISPYSYTYTYNLREEQ
jgi:hypothetical protein